MAASGTRRLVSEIERALPERPFRLTFWDGTAVPATTSNSAPTLNFRSPRALGHVLRAPGELGLGRAYVAGEIEVDDLDGVISLLGRWKTSLSRRQRARLGAAIVGAFGLRRLPQPPAAELRPGRQRHSRQRDAEAVRHHYDVPSEFFSLFLDRSMTYSCAYFGDGAETLEAAQEAKLDMVCRKLSLQPGQRLLDIGCGWGSLLIHAARDYDVSALGITLSEPQAEQARERVRAAGVADRVEVRVMDYRDLGAERFDAVASIGMVEHVGAPQIDEYARRITAVLKPQGRLLNHGITAVGPEVHIGDDFSERYVFPDAELLPISHVVAAMERAGLETLHVESLHRDYSETLRHWTARLEERLDEAERLAGRERLRVWRLYLRAARNGFEVGLTSVAQVLCSLPLTEPARTLPIAGARADSEAVPVA